MNVSYHLGRCPARVILIAGTTAHGISLRARRPEYSHALVIGLDDPNAASKLRGRLIGGWILAPGAEHGKGEKASRLIEIAQSNACRCEPGAHSAKGR